jgi:hypothetical protein
MRLCEFCTGSVDNTTNKCTGCGAPQSTRPVPAATAQPAAPITTNHNRMVIALVCWFLGVFGVHRFMTGHVGIGVLQLLTVGMCGIWTLIDLFMLITGSFRDAEGNIV